MGSSKGSSKTVAFAIAGLWTCGTAMRVRKDASWLTGEATDAVIMPVLENDFNPLGEGDIPGAHGLLIHVFGEGIGVERHISVQALRDISIDRKFPMGYTFNGTLHGQAALPANQRKNQLSAQERMVAGKGTPQVEASMANINMIICPYLSTMINMGALPLKQVYTAHELEEVTVVAGLDASIATMHVAGNFLNDPDGVQDLWNMEGFTNEHVSSTGISDCTTWYRRCQYEGPPHDLCQVWTERACSLPNSFKFDQFIEAVDQDDNGFVTFTELDEAAEVAEDHGIPVKARHLNDPVPSHQKIRPADTRSSCSRYDATLIGEPLGSSPHTVVMALWFDEVQRRRFGERQWLLNIGQETTGAHHWLWNGGRKIQFGTWSGSQVHRGKIQGAQTLATVYDGSNYRIFIDGDWDGTQTMPALDIQTTNISIGGGVEADFGGCIGGVDVYRSALSQHHVRAAIAELQKDVESWRPEVSQSVSTDRPRPRPRR